MTRDISILKEGPTLQGEAEGRRGFVLRTEGSRHGDASQSVLY